MIVVPIKIEKLNKMKFEDLIKEKHKIMKKIISLENNVTQEFNLVIWIADNGQNQNDEMKKNLTGKIRVDASQKIE